MNTFREAADYALEQKLIEEKFHWQVKQALDAKDLPYKICHKNGKYWTSEKAKSNILASFETETERYKFIKFFNLT